MENKEVGKLWQCASIDGCGHFSKAEVQWLIRKLIEERARWYAGIHRSVNDVAYGPLQNALRDFGIDPATWKETHDR